MATNDAAPPATAAELLERVQAAWEALERRIAGPPAARLMQPGTQGWSVADHLAHIAEWERATTAVLQRRPESEVFGRDPAELEGLGVDALNEILYQRHHGQGLAEVLELGRQAHAGLLRVLHGLEDADLQRSVAEYGGDPKDQRPLVERIAADTYAHYAEHEVWIGELLDAQG